jgi:hypothetical protein
MCTAIRPRSGAAAYRGLALVLVQVLVLALVLAPALVLVQVLAPQLLVEVVSVLQPALSVL